MSRDRGTRFYCLAECCDNCKNFNTKDSKCSLDNLKTLKNYWCEDFESGFVPVDNTLWGEEL